MRVKVVWSRGKGQLESKVGMINPKTHEAKIDDIFKMNTSLDFDETEYKFMPKNSVISIIFAQTSDEIGTYEFDLGQSANRFAGKTVKTTLDLKSDKFPGSQINIYANLLLKVPLPERKNIAGSVQGRLGGSVGGPSLTEIVGMDAVQEKYD